MKKTLIACAALATLASAAQAQNVTIYGRIDTGVAYVDKVQNFSGGIPVSGGSTGDSLTEVRSGGILPSIWGFRGSEDLGGGLKAVFNLEGDFDSSTGGSRGLGNISSLFGRQANVGLSDKWGTMLLGRQYSPALLADLGTEPRGFRESYSSLSVLAATSQPAGNTAAVGNNNGAGIFTSNMLSYSNAFGPVNVGLGYGFGEVAGSSSDGSTISVGLTYTGPALFGAPIIVSGSFQQIEGIAVGTAGSNGQTTRYSVGLAVPFGAFTGRLYYANAQQDGSGGTLLTVPQSSGKISDTDNAGIGLDWRWNPMNTFIAAYYYGNDSQADDRTNTLVLSNEMALSKRTTLYAQYVYVDSATPVSNGGTKTQVTGGQTQFDKSANIFNVGIKHDF